MFKKKAAISNPKYQYFHSLVEKYETIVIFRHVVPDFDAMGSQYGLYYYLKENYPRKKIYALGEEFKKFTNVFYPPTDNVDDLVLTNNPFLAIIVDSSEEKRISDTRYKLAKEIIKIDHHQSGDSYGNLEILEVEKVAAAEIIANILLANTRKKLPPHAAAFLYSGIVGDSGRFLYHNTSPSTFETAKKLTEVGFSLQKDVYDKMYVRRISDLAVQSHLLNNYILSKNGVAYYTLDKATLIKLGVSPTSGKEHINLFSGIKEINIWVSFSEDVEKVIKENGKEEEVSYYRVSIRSSKYSVLEVASKYRGGGHIYACGAKVYNQEEINQLIKELDALIK